MKFIIGQQLNNYEAAVEKLDPSGVSETDTWYFKSPQIIEVFGKRCACNIKIDTGCSNSGLSSFSIDLDSVKELNVSVPKLSKIIESAIKSILNECNDFYNATNEDKRILTENDIKKSFSYISAIHAKKGYKERGYLVVSLEGVYPYWDYEHGVGLKIRDGKVVEIGQGGQFF